MTMFIDRQTVQDGSSLRDLLIGFAQYQARGIAAATPLTDNSSGTASVSYAIGAAPDAVDTAVSGSNLADKTTTEAALVTVQNALATLFAKANAAATAIGLPTVTYNGGGVSGGNTVAAVTKTVTAATTGTPAAGYNAAQNGIEGAFYQLGALVNKLATATGHHTVDLSANKGLLVSGTVPAINTNTGTAAAPAVTAAKAGADLTVFANNVATFADRLTKIVSVAIKPAVVVIGN